MEARGYGPTKKTATLRYWEQMPEALAWAVVAAFVTLLLRAHQVARWDTDTRIGMLVVVVLLGVALTYLRKVISKDSRRFKSLEAESFVLKRDGVVLAKLAPGEGSSACLTLNRLNGTPIMTIGSAVPWGASLLVSDARGTPAMLLCEDEFAMFGEGGIKNLSVRSTLDGEPEISFLSGEAKTQRMRLAVEDGDPSITLLDKDGKERLSMLVFDDESHITLSAASG